MIVEKRALLRALKAVALVMEQRTTIPVLSTAVLRGHGSEAEMFVTNLDQAMTVTFPAAGKMGAYCQSVPAKLVPLVKAASGGEVEITSDAKAGVAKVTAGDLAIDMTQVLPADDMPAMPPAREQWSAEVGGDFMAKLARVSIAMSTEETRYYLNGVYMHHVEGWTYRLVATDGHRLVYANVEMPGAEGAIPDRGDRGGVIIPHAAVTAMLRLHADRKAVPVRLAVSAPVKSNEPPAGVVAAEVTQVSARFKSADEKVVLVSKLIDGTFPDYRRVVPGDDTYRQTAYPPEDKRHRVEMKNADIRRVMAAIAGTQPRHGRASKMTLENDRVVISRDAVDDHMRTVMTIPATVSGGDFSIGFNARYLRDQVTAAGGERTIMDMVEDSAPTLIYDPDDAEVRTVLMPMRMM